MCFSRQEAAQLSEPLISDLYSLQQPYKLSDQIHVLVCKTALFDEMSSRNFVRIIIQDNGTASEEIIQIGLL